MAATVMRSKSCCSMRRRQCGLTTISRKTSDCSSTSRKYGGVSGVSRKNSSVSTSSGYSDPGIPIRKGASVSRNSSVSSYNSYIRRKDTSVSSLGSGVEGSVERKVSGTSTCSSVSGVSVVRVVALEDVFERLEQVGRGCGCGCGVWEGAVIGGGESGGRCALHCHHKTAATRADLLRQARPALPDHTSLVPSSPHLYETDTHYVMVEEAAPCGTLRQALRRGGGSLGEAATKRVVDQVAAGLRELHLRRLVHRDICSDTVQVSAPGLQEVRLAGLGRVRTAGERVVKASARASWAAPEVAWAVEGETYVAGSAQDAWAVGVLVVVCLTGRPPWAAAHISDPHYRWWASWATRATTRPPPRFRCFTPRLLRLLRRLLHPRAELRAEVGEVEKYLGDTWVVANKPRRPALDQRLAATAAPLLARARAALACLLATPNAPALAASATHARRVRFAGEGIQEDQKVRAVSPPA